MSGDPPEVNEELTALLRARPVTPESDIQVFVTRGLREPLEAWLKSRGLYLFQIPSEDPIPTFGIGRD
jgi:hypothetical protein